MKEKRMRNEDKRGREEKEREKRKTRKSINLKCRFTDK